MRSDAGSETAIFTAIQRAAHQILDAPPRILDDPLAVGFAPGSSEPELQAAAPRLQQPTMKVLRSIFVFRSRFAEDALREAVDAGVRQLVVLGAGFDTFAFRQPPWARGLRIFEVDHPRSQEWKRRRLAERDIAVPANVRFCPVDFERVSLEAGLAAGGFERREPAFFSWLGVTQYLTRDAVLGTLRGVRALAPGTRIVFEIVLPDSAVPPPEQRWRGSRPRRRRRAANRGCLASSRRRCGRT
jgi:methyltransferase (TIGR00027 family)